MKYDLKRKDALLAEKSQDWRLAAKHWSQALALQSKKLQYLKAKIGFARCQKNMKLYSEAIKNYNEALAEEPDNIFAIIGVARCKMGLESYPEAITYYKQILEQEPDNKQALIGVARCKMGLESYTEAITYYKQILEQEPDNKQALWDVARCQKNLNLPDDSIATCKAILERHPDFIPALNEVTKAKIEGVESRELQIQLWKDALASNSNNFVALLSIAQNLVVLFRHDEAQKMFEKALLLKPDHISTLGNYGFLLVSLRKFDEAKKVSEKIKALTPESEVAVIIDTEVLYQQDESLLTKAPPSSYDFLFRKPLRPIINDDFTSDFIISPEYEKFDTVIIVFAGIGNRFSGFPSEILDRVLASYGVSAIYLKDPANNMYFNGVSSLADSEEQTVSKLKEYCTNKRVITLGFSGGGTGAIRYGLLMKASHIIGCAAFTNSTKEFTALHDTRAKATKKRLTLTFQDKTDIRSLALKQPGPKIDLFFGELHPQDTAQAKHLSSAPNVTLHPILGCKKHSLVIPFLQSGFIEECLS